MRGLRVPAKRRSPVDSVYKAAARKAFDVLVPKASSHKTPIGRWFPTRNNPKTASVVLIGRAFTPILVENYSPICNVKSVVVLKNVIVDTIFDKAHNSAFIRALNCYTKIEKTFPWRGVSSAHPPDAFGTQITCRDAVPFGLKE